MIVFLIDVITSHKDGSELPMSYGCTRYYPTFNKKYPNTVFFHMETVENHEPTEMVLELVKSETTIYVMNNDGKTIKRLRWGPIKTEVKQEKKTNYETLKEAVEYLLIEMDIDSLKLNVFADGNAAESVPSEITANKLIATGVFDKS